MIRTEDDIARGLAALRIIDPELDSVMAVAGAVPLRRSPGGLRGLVATMIGQQVSRASAEAILSRLVAIVDIDDPAAILGAGEAAFRRAGLSRAKQRTILGIAEAVRAGALDLDRIAAIEPGEAVAELVRLHGIGPWTAQCFLLFSAGHPDIFPAGDLALQVAVGHGLGRPGRVAEKALAPLAARWSPHRSLAARLFWSYYHAITRRDAAPAAPAQDPVEPAGAAIPAGFTKATR